MYCEICEKPIAVGKKVRVEGSAVIVCDGCSSFGEVVGEVDTKKPIEKKRVLRQKKPETFDIEDKQVLIEDYHKTIKKAREDKNLKQDALATQVNEPVSLIQRIESGKIEPSPVVGGKIAKKLGIRLYKKREGEDTSVDLAPGKELTLGDVVVVRKRKND